MTATDTTYASTFAGKTPAQWREEARRAREERAASWERCDTDGFLSQWASGVMADRYDHLAEIAENGGTIETVALFDLEGRYIDARHVEGRYGWVWVWDDAEGNAVWFNESSAQKEETRIKNNAKKGVYVGTAFFHAYYDNKTGKAEVWRTRGIVVATDNGQ